MHLANQFAYGAAAPPCSFVESLQFDYEARSFFDCVGPRLIPDSDVAISCLADIGVGAICSSCIGTNLDYVRSCLFDACGLSPERLTAAPVEGTMPNSTGCRYCVEDLAGVIDKPLCGTSVDYIALVRHYALLSLPEFADDVVPPGEKAGEIALFLEEIAAQGGVGYGSVEF